MTKPAQRARKQKRPNPKSAATKFRETATPRVPYEEIEIRTADGAWLRAFAIDPPDGVRLAGTCVLAHAMFARKTAFGRRDRKGLAHACAARGFRAIAFDFRGHGESTPPPDAPEWGYDHLVRFDLPTVVDCARARSEGLPLVVVGHSLGGHVALAAQGTGAMEADAIVGLGANVWMRAFEPSRLRWAAKVALTKTLLAIAGRARRFPARWLRLGSDDATERYLRDLFRGVTESTWGSADGRDDYLANLVRVTIPFANVLGTRDRIMCGPASGEAFTRVVAGPTTTFRADADHPGLVTKASSHPVVLDAIAWAADLALMAQGGCS